MRIVANPVDRSRRIRSPRLQFSPRAWAKLIYLRDLGPTEVGGFGISSLRHPLSVHDVCLVPQTSSEVSVLFDDQGVADFFDRKVDEGLQPCQFGRLWVHTHPGDDPTPSSVDEETFARCFDLADWAAMIIVARDDSTYARVLFHVGPRGSLRVPVSVDFTQPCKGMNHRAWREEYQANVTRERPRLVDLPEEDHWDQVLRELWVQRRTKANAHSTKENECRWKKTVTTASADSFQANASRG